ncbi:hypothetical protein BO83DRAFT_226137 [Aspergillus eucalypticola CBS 122712]|uniref:Uncharacterized protein n=1 Tax=Aspergillus eucalypticola (strain CBS 122712 / IBT 29274) TaxID=1448314 RepID=A0A317W0W3_ASPEC|nr:uncharacterized protein BO83DRAFT_226137 [Aspergillus eucalypticola CBS 122712]PWY77790.1 hypothetical protein BO83DRAFT_226137 [Aspergillus eucalypticola CBS 122712]
MAGRDSTTSLKGAMGQSRIAATGEGMSDFRLLRLYESGAREMEPEAREEQGNPVTQAGCHWHHIIYESVHIVWMICDRTTYVPIDNYANKKMCFEQQGRDERNQSPDKTCAPTNSTRFKDSHAYR